MKPSRKKTPRAESRMRWRWSARFSPRRGRAGTASSPSGRRRDSRATPPRVVARGFDVLERALALLPHFFGAERHARRAPARRAPACAAAPGCRDPPARRRPPAPLRRCRRRRARWLRSRRGRRLAPYSRAPRRRVRPSPHRRSARHADRSSRAPRSGPADWCGRRCGSHARRRARRCRTRDSTRRRSRRRRSTTTPGASQASAWMRGERPR